ncbi:MAG: FtsX-like permease family protein [Faecalibacterium prausnitzii]
MVLMVVSIITVGSTIRLSVFARRREIEIMKYVGATNRMVTLPFFVEGLTMGLISGILTAAVSLGCYSYVVNAAGALGGIWQMLMGRALVPVANVLPTIVVTSLAQRRYCRRRGQYVLYPQAFECVTERSRVL